jgi:hypothetical protein
MARSTMSVFLISGMVLVMLSLLAFAIPVVTTQQTTDVARIGELKPQTTESKSHVIPPFEAGGLLVVGVVLIGADFYRRR